MYNLKSLLLKLLEAQQYDSIVFYPFNFKFQDIIIKIMERRNNNTTFGNLYRQFSRQKYNKYRAQFPKLRQAQVVEKLIKQWDSYDDKHKEQLRQTYLRMGLIFQESQDQSQQIRNIQRQKALEKEEAERSFRTQNRDQNLKILEQRKNMTVFYRQGKISQEKYHDHDPDFNRESGEQESNQDESVYVIVRNPKPIKTLKIRKVNTKRWKQSSRERCCSRKASIRRYLQRIDEPQMQNKDYSLYQMDRIHQQWSQRNKRQIYEEWINIHIDIKLMKKKKSGKAGRLNKYWALKSIWRDLKKKYDPKGIKRQTPQFQKAHQELFKDKPAKYYPKTIPINLIEEAQCYTCKGNFKKVKAVQCSRCKTLYHKSQASVGRPKDDNKILMQCKPGSEQCFVCWDLVFERIRSKKQTKSHIYEQQ